MPKVKKQKEARSHSDSLNIVCAVCWRKPKSVRKVTEKISDQINRFSSPEYDLKNYYHPKVICDSCRVILGNLNKDEENCNRNLPPAPDYKSLVSPPPTTRSALQCQCKICEIDKDRLYKACHYAFKSTGKT